ncbi:MAG: rRNA (guanine745-N1)-methyltransferase [Thermoleophilaceae bacterium]|nr:rRNA (guanine745-N1)-methyltransferase [Thermoleophilaceae bacterium]
MPALDNVLPLLRCPLCATTLARDGAAAAVRCGEGHSFDVARQGYLSLLAGEGAHTGDTAEMVAARERVLAAGHFERLAAEVTAAVAERAPGVGERAAVAERAQGVGEPAVGERAQGEPASPACILDLGAGTGWYLARLLDALPAARGLAVDVSKPALRRAARAHPRLAAVACDAWRPLPLRDGAVAAVLNVFAPRDAAELARVLAPGGLAVVVTPAPAHLGELVAPLGLLAIDARKDERLAERLSPHLDIVDRRELEWTVRLDHAAARDLAAMGPSAFHVSPAELDQRVAALPQSLEVTAAVTLTLATASAPRARPPAPAAAACAAARRRSPPASRPPRSPGGRG